MDIVARLRADKPATQFNRGGVLEHYTTVPSSLDLEAAQEIERLRELVDELERELAKWKTIAESRLGQIEIERKAYRSLLQSVQIDN